MKFLKTIRFDPSDYQVFERAAEANEWAIPGGFCFAKFEQTDIVGKIKQAFSNGFFSLDSFGFSTFVSVAEIERAKAEELSRDLARYFVSHFDAPNIANALPAAESEVGFVAELCAGVPINSIFTVRRFFDESGEIMEEFRLVDAPDTKTHTRVWEVIED